MRARVRQAKTLATSQVTYAEVMASFGRRQREMKLTTDEVETLVAELERLWPDLAILAVDEMAAGRLALKHGLRGFDAIHLAAALRFSQGTPAIELEFLSFDKRQNSAATTEGLIVAR